MDVCMNVCVYVFMYVCMYSAPLLNVPESTETPFKVHIFEEEEDYCLIYECFKEFKV
jgi:hypothetical protein